MDKDQKALFEETIKKKMNTIKEDISAYERLTIPIAPDNAIGRLTRMEAIASKSINETALKNARETLSRLERALAKIDRPDFGLCMECGEPIPSARLMILPETGLCVQCAENRMG